MAAETLRREFSANVSHELKTPLASVQATVETLLDGALNDPKHNMNFLGRINENVDRLNRLVNDLLEVPYAPVNVEGQKRNGKNLFRNFMSEFFIYSSLLNTAREANYCQIS